MKNDIEDIVDWIENRHSPQYMDELTPEEFTSEVLTAVVELELPVLQQRLKQYEGKKFETLGKIDFLNELEQTVQQR